MMNRLRAYDLRTEYRERPLGVDVAHPRLSWRLASDDAGVVQQAYRIAVTSASRHVWSSGWVQSGECFGVEIPVPLEPATSYEWTLQLRSNHGEDEDEDEEVAGRSWFETALDGSLTGDWIAIDPTYDFPDKEFDPPTDDDIPSVARHILPAAHLRREFVARGPVVRARASATAHGIYRLHVNGQRVGSDELAPGWTDYRERIQYQSYDVTEMLDEGVNVVGAQLADGWWSGYVGFDLRRQGKHYGVAPEFWMHLAIDYADGSSDTIVTDGEWMWAHGPIRYTDLLMGECVDRRFDLGDWASAGLDTTAWGPVTTNAVDFASFHGDTDEQVTEIARLPAVSVTLDAHGRALYDFGQNLVGRVRIELGDLADGQRIVLRHGETLENGELYTANLRSAQQQDVYISAGGGADVFEPAFTLHGFRYLEVAGLGVAGLEAAALEAVPSTSAVTAIVLANPTAPAGQISTSSDDVNQLISNIAWGQRGNFVGLPTDCPQRDERLGWMADAQVFLPTAAYNADVAAFFTRWLADVRGAQSAEGSFPDVAPVVSQFFTDGAPAWADAGVIIPWHLYRVYGDRRLLADSWESMRRWVDFVERHNPSLIWTKRVGNHYGDWLQIDAVTPRPLLATAYFAHSADLVAKAAEALGMVAEAAHYRALHERIRDAFLGEFAEPDGTLQGDTQTAYLLAIAFDLVAGEVRELAAQKLVAAVERHDGLLTTGFVGVSLLCPVLSEIGRDDLAFALLETDRYPSWLYSVRQGATTIWERWDGWTEHAGFQSVEMNSFNHYSLGSVGEWLYRYVAGIDQAPGSVAFEKLLIAPRPGGTLTRASASYESIRGLIESAWTLEGETFTLDILVPPGASATVVLPNSERHGVTAGRHRFVAELAAGMPAL